MRRLVSSGPAVPTAARSRAGLARAWLPGLVLAVAVAGCKKDEPEALEAESAPELEVETPAEAAWLAPGEVEVSGLAKDLASVSVNGVEAALSGDTFVTSVPLARGINVIEAVGEIDATHSLYSRHSVLAGDFADPDGVIDRAIAIRLNQGGLDGALAAAAGLLDAETLNAQLAGINPVYEDAYGLFGWDAVVISADIGSIGFDTPRLTAVPAGGVLDLEVALPNLEVWVPVEGEIVGIGFDTEAWIGATSAEVGGLLTLDVDANGKLVADLTQATVTLEGFWYDTTLIPGDVEEYLLVDTVRGALEDAILEQIDTLVPALLEEQLAALELSFSTELLGTTVDIGATFDTASIDRDGLLVIADLDVTVPGSGDHPYEGYLAAGSGDPRPDVESDLALAVSDDLLNRVLFEAWNGGLLALTLSSDDGSLDPILLSQLGARDEATVKVDARLPPVVVETPDGLQAQIGELQVTIFTPGGDMGEFLDLSVAAFVGLELAVEDGEVVLELLEPELQLMVRSSDWGISNERITNLLADQLPIDTLLLLMGDFRFPLPTVGTLGIGTATAERDGSGLYTQISASLQ